MTETAAIHYKTLNALIDQLLKTHTAETACIVLKKALELPVSSEKNDDSVREHIMRAGIAVFGLNIHKLKRRKTKVYIRERWSFYYLIKKHTNYSLADIAHYWKLESKKPIRYGIQRITDLLQNPKIDKEHYALHMQLQEKIDQFIAIN